MNINVTLYINNCDPKLSIILKTLRALIYSKSIEVKEQFKWGRPVYKLTKDFCYIRTTKKQVVLGFFNYKKIKTNTQLITGTGKAMRHIKLNNVEDIKRFKISEILDEILQ